MFSTETLSTPNKSYKEEAFETSHAQMQEHIHAASDMEGEKNK
jgi:hypothetical protein